MTRISMPRITRGSFGLLAGAALLMAALTFGSTTALAQFLERRPLTLQNGWTNAPFSTSSATVEKVSGIVQFKGAIGNGTTAVAFTLPTGFRPATDVYVVVDLCNATKGRLHITAAGVVDIEAENGTFTNAQCFTSLDGASFVTANNFPALTLINGWTNAPFATSNAAAQKISGIVHFKGAIATSGTNPDPFVMPATMRPAADVYIPIDLCNSTTGRLHITSAGIVDVEAEGGVFSNAQCFTSLDGVWFVSNSAGYTPLTLINGWTNAPFGTGNAAAGNAYGLVYLKGAIATGGTNPAPFTLAPSFRPVNTTYVHVDLCNSTNGRLVIQSNGVVSVQVETDFSNAQCFTSLDGVSFVQ